ncbi:hypothetical protein A3A75_02060 [Candidatus Woesebacteria bacterium RIFCSPLOWO2_01_FULL_39_10]|uniref:Uncharacterized protein n=1 Tax=Candidatus Woesebacteria bacterium RIFCSPLOWO2_01_FULL_39_10 TaxID=1802516 RepID=A0A1F8B7N6_9BACT|nr:MAG: hypothetical protein A3A75_02060 [Candidatus Woesebacteria bacterium RIFCSPLOWO2_01_FULL_39_10]
MSLELDHLNKLINYNAAKDQGAGKLKLPQALRTLRNSNISPDDPCMKEAGKAVLNSAEVPRGFSETVTLDDGTNVTVDYPDAKVVDTSARGDGVKKIIIVPYTRTP